MSDDKPGVRPLDRKAAARHDRHFADDFIPVAGAAVPLSLTLAHQLGYRIERPRYTAGSDPDDGAIADDYRPE